MGTPLFGIDIAGIINDVVSPGVPPVTLVKSSPGTRTPGALAGGTNPTTSTHMGRGFEETRRPGQRFADNSIVVVATKIVTITGDSISPSAVPEPGDRVTSSVGGPYTIAAVYSDPAQAVFECSVNG